MPSLRDQLQSLLPAWEEEQNKIEQTKQTKKDPKATMEQVTVAHRFKPTNNASRETFNAVRDFPKQTAAFYVNMLEKKGFKATTTSSLLYQMVRQGQIDRDGNNLLTTNANAYTPLKTAKTIKLKEAKKEQSSGIAALPAQDSKPKVSRSLLINHNWDAQKEVDKLSVTQARALYDLLTTIFKG